MTSIITKLTTTTTTALGTVDTVANSISRGVNTLASTLDMANVYVEAAKKRQIANTKADMATFMEELKERVKTDTARRRVTIARELASDQMLHDEYDKCETEFKDLFAEIQADLK